MRAAFRRETSGKKTNKTCPYRWGERTVMSGMENVAAFTRQIVSDCGLDSASVFVCDRTNRRPVLKYLYHYNISEEVQHIYHSRLIFHSDPFTDSRRHEMEAPANATEMLLARVVQKDPVSPEAAAYWDFIQHYGIDVVGASARRLIPGLYATLGFHRKAGSDHSVDVPLKRLGVLAEQLQNMLSSNILQGMLEQSNGQDALRGTLYSSAEDNRELDLLSPRERAIAEFIRQGRLNKEVAFLTGLSEHTVENHLRRIYRKLGIHNRTSLVAMMAH